MSVQGLRIDDIYYAIEALKSEAQRAEWNARGWEERDRAKGLKRTAQRASEQYAALSRNWDRTASLSAEADRQYDRYVTRDREPSPEGCSCHISPPCSFCTRETEEEHA